MPPEPTAACNVARRRTGSPRPARRRGRLAGPLAATLLALIVAVAVGPAVAGPGAHPDDGDGCPPPSCACVVHLGAVQIAPPETPTTAARPTVAGRLATEGGPARAERSCGHAHRPRGPPSRDDA